MWALHNFVLQRLASAHAIGAPQRPMCVDRTPNTARQPPALKIERQAFEFHSSLTAVIARPELLAQLRAALRRSPVVALFGPRQSGETTAARWIVKPDSAAYFDLEDLASLARLVNSR